MAISLDDTLSNIHLVFSPGKVEEVAIETARLRIQPVTKENLDDYKELFGDPVAMGKYAAGQTKDSEYVEKRFDGWLNRWNDGDPFSALAIFKKDTGDFIGHIILGYGDEPGQSETAILLKPSFWQNGYGREAVSVILEYYAPMLAEIGCTVEGSPLREIVATARVDSVASIRIFSSYMDVVGTEEKYGATRYKFSKVVQPLEIDKRINSSIEELFNREPQSA